MTEYNLLQSAVPRPMESTLPIGSWKLKRNSQRLYWQCENKDGGGIYMAATIQENLVMTAKNDKSATERVKKRKTIKELFNGFHGNYIPIEIDWGNPVGKEIC